MRNPVFVFICLMLVTGHSLSQDVIERNLLIRNPSPYFRLSSDGKLFSYTASTEDGKRSWENFFDVSTITWHGNKGSVDLQNVKIMPDMRSAYGRIANADGFKGNEHWQKYKKFLCWYYPSDTSYNNKIQWADKNWIVAGLPDGTLLTLGKIEFKKQKFFDEKAFGFDLNISDTKGNTIKTLRAGQIIESNIGNLPKEKFWLVENNTILAWIPFGKDIRTIPLNGGETRTTVFQDYYELITGKFVVTVKLLSSVPETLHELRVTNIITGERVATKPVNTKAASGLWVAPAATENDFYTFNGLTSMLTKQHWTGTSFEATDSVRMETGDLLPKGHWMSTYDGDYQLLVSEQVGHVLFVPRTYKATHSFLGNTLMVWDLATGKMKYKSPNFIVPYDSYLQTQQRIASNGGVAFGPLPFNQLVLGPNGRYYVLLSQHALDKTWSVIQFTRDRHGSYTGEKKELPENAFSNFNTKVVSSTTCPACRGGGTAVERQQHTHEKTDKMIYTQITTTTTSTVNVTVACQECNGLGFKF